MRINIINGDGKYVKEGIDKTIDAAIKYYGEKYKDIILATVKETLFYEWKENQTESEVFYEITGNKEDEEELIDYEEESCDEIGGEFYIHEKDNDEYDSIIIFKNKYLKDNYHYLVHELYGHAVYSHINPIIYENNIKYHRNGICYIDCEGNDVYNETINEGFVEDATKNIMKLANLEPYWLEHYFKSKQAADIIKRNIGHEKLYDGLILDKEDIAAIYNENSQYHEFAQLSYILDDDFEYKENPKLNRLYNENIRRFIKRREKKNR